MLIFPGSKKRKKTSSAPMQRSSAEEDTDYQRQNDDSDSDAQIAETPTKSRTFTRSSRIVDEPAYRPSTSEDEGDTNDRPPPLTISRNKDQYYVQPHIEEPSSTAKHKRKSPRLQTDARHDLFVKYTSQPAIEYEAALFEAYTAYVKGITPPPTDNTQPITTRTGSHAPNAISMAHIPHICAKTFVQMVNDLGVKKEEDVSSRDMKQAKEIKKEESIREEDMKEDYIKVENIKEGGVKEEGVKRKDTKHKGKKEAEFNNAYSSKKGEGYNGIDKKNLEKAEDEKSLYSTNATLNILHPRHPHFSSKISGFNHQESASPQI
jgi:hypothetical protein